MDVRKDRVTRRLVYRTSGVLPIGVSRLCVLRFAFRACVFCILHSAPVCFAFCVSPIGILELNTYARSLVFSKQKFSNKAHMQGL